MSLNNTPSAERLFIAFFGRTNAGKSSVINAVTGQALSIVSDIKGTTTDPVQKAMEILPLGPVVIIDTPGLDDESELGKQRIEKAYQVMNKTNIAVLVIDSTIGKTKEDEEIEVEFKKRNIPYIIVWNKADLLKDEISLGTNEILVSAEEKTNIDGLKDLIKSQMREKGEDRKIIGDFLSPDDFLVLVVPIDESAPKGRLILPQQQTIRDILDSHANAVVCQTSELKTTLRKLKGLVKVVVTDSQAFKDVMEIVPKDIYLTSFSILFARYKGDLEQNINGAETLDQLKDGAKILISEGCTHHRQCEDIGTVKLPRWIEEYTGKKFNFGWTSGGEFTKTPEKYDLIIHCGGCMLNGAEIKSRLKMANEKGVPMTNYGISIAKMNGILDRSIEIFKGNY